MGGIRFLPGTPETKKGDLQQKTGTQMQWRSEVEEDADSTPPWFQVSPLLNSAGHAASFEKLFYCCKSNHIRFPSLTSKGIFTKTMRRNASAYAEWVHYEHPCNGIEVVFNCFS